MANNNIPRPDAPFRAWRNKFATYVNRHPADFGLVTEVMGAEIWIKVSAPPPTPLTPGWARQKTQS